MNWTILIWILLYFAVGWILTSLYDLEDDDIGKLIVFIGWPVIVAVILIVLVVLFIFGVVLVIDELIRDFRNKGD